ncbi:hypothetical protein VTK73DRAFT_4367 [Phialemonium thermophilum]|uniref:Uncharacterized protein n=1 Tax=Phialemonium thermophilum TaxID=223376 RepID=A0ABR3Y0C3_9PEZI
MAWGKSKAHAHPPSTLSQLLPLILVILFVGVTAWVGYQIYLSVEKVRAAATEKMGSKNVVFTKDGVRVGVKHVENESYVDKTQSWVVKAWNLAGTGKGQNTGKEIQQKQQSLGIKGSRHQA